MPTGFYLNELAVPAQYLSDHGYEIVLATPKGNKPVMDSGSNSPKFFKDQAAYGRALAFVASLQPIRIADADQKLDTFAGIFIPGGHAPMNDLASDTDLYTALKFFHEHQKPTATICHGAAGLLAGMENAAVFREDLTTGNTKNAQMLKNSAAKSSWAHKCHSTLPTPCKLLEQISTNTRFSALM